MDCTVPGLEARSDKVVASPNTELRILRDANGTLTTHSEEIDNGLVDRHPSASQVAPQAESPVICPVRPF